MNRTWQVCGLLVAIFAAGGISGGLVAYRVARQNLPHPPPPEVWVPRQFERFSRVLGLTPEQRQRIQPIMAKNIKELVTLRRESILSGREVIDRMDAAIANELTPEQRTKFESMVKARREAWRRMEDRAEHIGRRHPAGAPPDEGAPPPPPPADKTSGT